MSATDNEALLDRSRDPRELVAAGTALASSTATDDQRAITRRLTDDKFLARLDTDTALSGDPQDLNLARILEALADNAAARETLSALAADKAFVAADARVELLISAAASVRPPTSAVLALWRDNGGPTGVFRHITVGALADNGSPEALSMLATMLAGSGYQPVEQIAWLRDAVLRHRYDEAMLRLCESLLKDGSAAHTHTAVIQVLFDYRPEEWYFGEYEPKPAEIGTLSPEGKRILTAIGRDAIASGKLDAIDRAQVEATLAGLE